MLAKAWFFAVVLLALWVPFHLTAKVDRAAGIAGEIKMSRSFDHRELNELIQASPSAGMFLVADLFATAILAFIAYRHLLGRSSGR